MVKTSKVSETVAKLRGLMADKYQSSSKKLKSHIQGLVGETGFHWDGNMDFGKWKQQGLAGDNYLNVVGGFVGRGLLPIDLSGNRVLDAGAWTGQSSLLLSAMGASVTAVEEVEMYAGTISYLADFFKADIGVFGDSLYNCSDRLQACTTYTEEDKRLLFDYVLFSGGLHNVSDPIVALRILYNSLVDYTGTLLIESACNQQLGRTCTYSVPTRIAGSTIVKRESCNWFIPSVTTAKQMCLHVGFITVAAWQTASDRVMLACRKGEQVDMPRVGLSRGDLR